MPKKDKIVIAFSAISATVITYFTLTTKKCPPAVEDCISGKVGGFPLKFRALGEGVATYFNINYLAFFADLLFFFLIIFLLTNFVLNRLDRYGVKFPLDL